MHYHNTATQSRSAWTEQEDELLRQAVTKFGDRAWATVANDVPGRSSKSCSDRWRNFLSPDIEHPRKSPFTEWEVAVVVLAQGRYGNNWKAISMLLPGRTNRAVKNLFVGNLKWGARLVEIRNRWLEANMSLEELLEIKPDNAGGAVKLKPGMNFPVASGSPSSFRAASTSSAGSAWASDMTDQPLSGSPASAGTQDRRRRGEGGEMNAGQSPPMSKRRRGVPSPVMIPQHYQHPGSASYSPNVVPHPGALGPGLSGSPILAGLPAGLTALSATGGMGPPGSRPMGLGTPTMTLGPSHTGALVQVKQRVSSDGSAGPLLMQVMDEGSPSLAPGGAFGTYGRAASGRSSSMSAVSMLMPGQQGAAALMASRISSWHAGGMAPPGIDVAAAAAAAANNGSNSPFAAMAGTPIMSPMSRGLSNLNPMRGMLKVEQGLESLDCTAPGAYSNIQHHSYWPEDASQQHMGHYKQQQELEHPPQQQSTQFQQLNSQQQPADEQGFPASNGPQPALGAGLQLPGSPPQLLQDMRSNDSAAFQQMLEQIFDEGEDDIISDPQTMHRLDGIISAQQALASQQQQQPPLPAMEPASVQYADPAHAAMFGLDANMNGPQRSNTWPNSWPDLAADSQTPAAPAAGNAAGSFGGAPPAHTTVSTHPSGVPIPPRSLSANGTAPGAVAAGMDQQHWAWGQGASSQGGATGMPNHGGLPGPRSLPGSMPGSGPPSTGGYLPQQDMQALCHQLQQENMKLMAHVSKLQHRLNSQPQELPDAGDMGLNMQGQPAQELTPSSAATNMDTDLPRLPPVRVGGSTGGAAPAGSSSAAAAAGWGAVGLSDEGSGGLGGVPELAGLGVDLSPDGTFTPGGLLDDSHGGDLLQGI